MTDEELQAHLDSLTTPKLAWLQYAYANELRKRAALDAYGVKNEDWIGQESVVYAVFAACMTNQSLLLVGPSNTGKTLLRKLASRMRPTILLGECRPDEKVKRLYDGAIDMEETDLDALLLGDGRGTLTDANWAKSYWRPVEQNSDLADEYLLGMDRDFNDLSRCLKWAKALAALDRECFVGVRHAKQAESMVSRAYEMFER